MLDLIRALWQANPVRITAVIAAAVIGAAAKLGIVVDEQSVTGVIALIVPVLLGGEVARAKVTPAVHAGARVASDDLLPAIPEELQR